MRPHDTTSCLNKLAPPYPKMPRMCRINPQTQFPKVHVNKPEPTNPMVGSDLIEATILKETPSAQSQIMFAYMSNRSNPTTRHRQVNGQTTSFIHQDLETDPLTEPSSLIHCHQRTGNRNSETTTTTCKITPLNEVEDETSRPQLQMQVISLAVVVSD